ncbi:MAG: FIVAR domain-containing protein, partial [Clostridia bacterium]|nr:FIVAR domain-containing protein [Clostridia bacterium]
MKNKVFKKVLSVFLSLLMIMAYFGSFSVFMPITAKALPATVDTYVKTDAYGTPKWNANADRWFKWAYNSDYVKVHYPSNIYLDVTETLQSAGYYFNVEWHFGDSSNYRVLLGAPIWGDYTAYSGYPSAYYTMTNIFSDYKVDAELPTNAPAGLYGKTNSSTNFDLRIVGYGWDGQGSDGFTFNNVRHDKYVLWRNNVNRTDPMYTKIFLMGTPSSSASGKTQAFNTSGGDIASFGLLQQYNSGWGNADSRHMFNKKGTGGQSSQSAVDCSNYTEYSNGTYWPEMAWNVTVYDKSSLKNEINKAADLINRFAGSKDKIVAGNWDTFLAENSQAENQIIIREQTQSNINTAKNELYNAAYALYIGADKSELTTAINQANAIRNAADYTAKYSEASRQALDNAVNAALSAAVYASTPTYHLYTNNDAANLVAADQNEIARLTSDINLAKANLVGTLYELTFKFNGGTSTLKYVWQGNEVVAPDNSTKAPDSLYHYTYTWSPAIVSPPTGNVTYTETLSYEGHNFGGWTVTMDSTCTAVGAKQRSCITCGYIETDVVEKLEHTPMAPVEKDRIEPDCITDGSYTKEIWCEKCGNMISSETVTLKATGHTFNETVNANEATCTADGNLAYKTCSVCNLYFAGDAAVNSVDGKTTNEDFILASSGHALVHFTANAAKCGVAGNIEYWRCGNCNGYYLDAAATMPTTATAVVLPAREHSYNAVKHEATCTNGEYYTYTCANCGDTKTSEEGEPLPHPYVFVKNDPAPTCTTGGTAHYECSVCKATKTESVDALGHSAVFVPFEDSTCTETGVKAHWFCAQCNTAFEDEDCTVVLDSIVVELKDHSWSDWNETLAPTCSATGLEVRECSVCHETEEQTKAIDPNAHKWNAYEDLGNGKHTRTCEYDAENHQQVVTCTYGDWMTTTQPDCLTAGEQTKTCQFCTGTATQPVAALGHTFGATVAANEATCTAKGNEAYKQCETCSLYFAADAATDAANGENEASAFDIAMLEHTYATEINRVPSTCKTAGSVTMACGCGAEQTTALELDADNHEKLVKLEAKAATCSATGLTEGEKCEACGVVTVAQTETAKLAHTEATREEDKVPATCGKDGSYTLVTYCSVCDEVIKEEEKVIPATGEHVYATEINRVPSTCKTAGSVTMACGCGAEQTTVLELDADNHEKLVKLEAKAATCSATGL